MKIDEAAFAKAMSMPCGAGRGMFRTMLENYLAALAPAEPGRDRIAVVVDGEGTAFGWDVNDLGTSDEIVWRSLEREAERVLDMTAPFARAVIRCNLPRPAEPVEVEGSVEVVEP